MKLFSEHFVDKRAPENFKIKAVESTVMTTAKCQKSLLAAYFAASTLRGAGALSTPSPGCALGGWVVANIENLPPINSTEFRSISAKRGGFLLGPCSTPVKSAAAEGLSVDRG
ncbi:hypothetical protein [Mycobacterium sp.]|uniref:hypothetical protein n=1 Tax=Mycobacterium sp. TaxID=1785 RepID=UPI0025DED406|nr:hypothetical protein [Mycobacterium sp.]